MSVEPPLMRDVLNGVLNSRISATQFGAAFPDTQLTPQELAAGITPVNYAYQPGDVRRQGMVDDSSTDNSDAFQSVLNAFAGNTPILIPRISTTGGYYRMTKRITVPVGADIIFEGGAELRWTATTANGTQLDGVATSPGLEIIGNDVIIYGNGTITGPSVATYVQNEMGIWSKGTSATARRSGFSIVGNIEIRNWGAYGLIQQFVDNIYVDRLVYVHDCGYAGAMFFSCDNGTANLRVASITPGTGGNAYGISFTHISTGYSADPTINPFCRVWSVGAVVMDIPLWTGVDAHGGSFISYIGAKTFNCRFGLAIASGSAVDDSAFAGEGNAIMGCVVLARRYDGSATTITNPPTGITVDGGSTDAQRGIRVTNNTVDGYGDSSGTYSISAIRTQDAVITNNTIRNWKGIGINADSAGNVSISENVFGAVASATLSKCIKVSGTGSFSFIGNKHKPSSGTTALEGLRVDDASTPRIVARGNDFLSATLQFVNDTGSLLDGTRFRDDSQITPRIDVTGTPTTVDVSVVGMAPIVWIYLNVSGAHSLTDFTNSFPGMEIILYSPTTNVTTFTRANAALPGGVNYTSTQYDVLRLLTVPNTGGVRFAAQAAAAVNS